jgi:hypothetical protein
MMVRQRDDFGAGCDRRVFADPHSAVGVDDGVGCNVAIPPDEQLPLSVQEERILASRYLSQTFSRRASHEDGEFVDPAPVSDTDVLRVHKLDADVNDDVSSKRSEPPAVKARSQQISATAGRENNHELPHRADNV